MPRGYWIAPGGEIHPTLDHWTFMNARPELFGVRRRDAHRWTIADRQRELDAAIARGWIRVRGPQPHLALQYHLLTPDVFRRIRVFFAAISMDPRERSLYEEISTGESRYEPASWIPRHSALHGS